MYPNSVQEFGRKYDPNLRGLYFVCVGVFALLMALGYYAPWVWRPIPAVASFVSAYAAFWLLDPYYHFAFAPHVTRRDPAGEHTYHWLWGALLVVFTALLFFGASAGFAANAAAVVVAGWLLAYRLVRDRIWGHYAFFAAALAVSAVLPVALGWSDPALFAVLFLGAGGTTMVATGAVDHVLRVELRNNRWGGEI